jgi:hypothetical protein
MMAQVKKDRPIGKKMISMNGTIQSRRQPLERSPNRAW